MSGYQLRAHCGFAMKIVAVALFASPAMAQIDISGEWAPRIHEDTQQLRMGAHLGDYTGLPVNAAARQKANHWDAGILAGLEHMAKPHSLMYAVRGPAPNLRITKVTDPVTQALRALTVEGHYGRADRVIWMDGRPHPSKYAEHRWDGYSTGRFEGNQLVVTTTHMKYGVYQRNGVPSSPYAVMTERFMRHGEYLVHLTVMTDPDYLEEPLVRSSQWQLTSSLVPDQRYWFQVVEETSGASRGYVPNLPFGTVPTGFAKQFGIPLEAAMGGKEIIYPEYEMRLRILLESDAKAATPGARGSGNAAN